MIPNLANYQITEQLYASPSTLVYRGIRSSNQQPVVIKLLRNKYPNFNEIVQFWYPLNLSRLKHPTNFTVVVDLLLPTEQLLRQILDFVVGLVELLLLHVN